MNEWIAQNTDGWNTSIDRTIVVCSYTHTHTHTHTQAYRPDDSLTYIYDPKLIAEKYLCGWSVWDDTPSTMIEDGFKLVSFLVFVGTMVVVCCVAGAS